jgi:hypothetical protein
VQDRLACRQWVMSVALRDRQRPLDFRYALIATEVEWQCNM